MDCLNAGLPSIVALPTLEAGIDTFVAVGDGWADDAVTTLTADGVATTPTGAAGLAGLLALAERGLSDFGGRTVLLINSEGSPAIPDWASWMPMIHV
jgi:diaminopropionate ammonia-lyase